MDPSLPSISPLLMLQASTTVPSFLRGFCGEGELGLHTCEASTLPGDQLPSPLMLFLNIDTCCPLWGEVQIVYFMLCVRLYVSCFDVVFLNRIFVLVHLGKDRHMLLNTHSPIQIPFLIPQAPSASAPTHVSLHCSCPRPSGSLCVPHCSCFALP